MAKTESAFSSARRTPSRARERASREHTTHDKRERILRAAIKVFARKGFYAARVNEIAKAAGVADGTIYLYFKNKDDVLVSLFDDRMRKLLTVLREEAAKVEPIDQKLARVIELQLGLLEGRRDLAEVITVNLRQSTRLLKQYAAPLFIEYLEVLGGMVAHGQRAGVLRDDVHPLIAARALWGAIDGIVLTWALGGAEPGALGRAGRELSAFWLDGMRGRSNALGPARTPNQAPRS